MNAVIQVILVSLLIAGAVCQGKPGGKCMSEMKAVGKCCNFEINPTSMMNSPTCKHLMEGVEGAEKKEKYKAIACMTECFYKEKGALNAAGEIVKEKMQALIDSELKDHPEFKAVANASVDKCLEQSKKKGNPEGGDTCNKLPFKMNMCLMGEILTNCPASKWTNSEECKTAKDKLSSDECKKN